MWHLLAAIRPSSRAHVLDVSASLGELLSASLALGCPRRAAVAGTPPVFIRFRCSRHFRPHLFLLPRLRPVNVSISIRLIQSEPWLTFFDPGGIPLLTRSRLQYLAAPSHAQRRAQSSTSGKKRDCFMAPNRERGGFQLSKRHMRFKDWLIYSFYCTHTRLMPICK
jgi:hypothetical protein